MQTGGKETRQRQDTRHKWQGNYGKNNPNWVKAWEKKTKMVWELLDRGREELQCQKKDESGLMKVSITWSERKAWGDGKTADEKRMREDYSDKSLLCGVCLHGSSVNATAFRVCARLNLPWMIDCRRTLNFNMYCEMFPAQPLLQNGENGRKSLQTTASVILRET